MKTKFNKDIERLKKTHDAENEHSSQIKNSI